MSALVKLNNQRIIKYIGLEEAIPTTSRITRNSMSIELEGGIVEILSGKEPGINEEGIIEANQKAKVTLGTIEPFKYNPMTTINPALLELADVRVPTIYEAGEHVEIALYITAHKKINVNTLNWLIRLYLID